MTRQGRIRPWKGAAPLEPRRPDLTLGVRPLPARGASPPCGGDAGDDACGDCDEVAGGSGTEAAISAVGV